MSVCAHHHPTAYQVTNADHEPSRVEECDACHHRHLPIVDHATGAVTWKWLPKSGYCAQCRVPIFRFATDPSSGQPVQLWPGPDVVSAQFTHASGGLSQPIDFCRDCLPRKRARTKAVLTAGGVPIKFGACTKHIPPRERYAAWFTNERRDFFAAWSRDHLLLDDEQHATFMAQWNADRADIFA